MTTKTITVTEDAYEHIKRLKQEQESFSGLFLRLAGEKMKISNLAGVLGKNEREATEWIKRSATVRRELSTALGERVKHVHS